MNNKKTIIIIILILLVAIVGITIAYFSNTTSIDNLFSTKEYGATVVEEFVSPDKWLPGTTTDKQISVTNSGQVDEAVRISYQELWITKDGTILSGLIDEDGNLTDDTENSFHAAIINFSDNNDWTYDSGYYYYNYKLSPNETTSSLIDSVTFNSKVKNSSNCTTTENNGTKTITCNSTNSGYDGATYTLTFKIETVQFNKYMSAWNTDVAIAEEKPAEPTCSYEFGYEIKYSGEQYYVLQDASDYVVALKKSPLTVNDVNYYSTDYTSTQGEYSYFESDNCYDYPWAGEDSSECTSNYNQSLIKILVDSWANDYNNDLKEVEGYKARLINKDEVDSYFNYEAIANNTSDSIDYKSTSNTPEWAILNNGKRYWTMTAVEDSNYGVYVVYGELKGDHVGRKNYIRPVINLKKSAIENKCGENNYDYTVGENITYKGNDYCVISNSLVNENYVTLIKQEPLTYDELVTYNNGYEIGSFTYVNEDEISGYNDIGRINYYNSDSCYSGEQGTDISGCNNNYETSFVKTIINNWSDNFSDDLVKVGRFKTRLLTIDDLLNIGYYIDESATSIYLKSSDVPSCIARNYSGPDTDDIYFWTMTSSDDTNSLYTLRIDGRIQKNSVLGSNGVRPVINLKKCAIDGTC